MERFTKMKVSELKSHPKNIEIYGANEDVTDLAEKIKRSGQVHTLTVTSKGIILAWHRRAKVCELLNIEEVDVEIRDFDTYEQEIEFIIDNNATREKSIEQKAREARELKKAIEAIAEKRKLSKLKQNQATDVPKMAPRTMDDSDVPNLAARGTKNTDVPEMAPRDNEKQGRTRDIIAPIVGFKSGQEVDRAIKAVDKIDALTEQGRVEDANLLRGVLNKRNPSAAESLVKVIDKVDIPEDDRKDIQAGKKSINAVIKKVVEQPVKEKDEYVPLDENMETRLVHFQKNYVEYLSAFQKDISWLSDMDFYRNEEDISEAVHSDLRNCFEKLNAIKEFVESMKMDEFGGITLEEWRNS